MNYKQLKILAVLCMVFDHVVHIFPLYRMFVPLADWLWSSGHDAAADWLLDGLTSWLPPGRAHLPLLHRPGPPPHP